MQDLLGYCSIALVCLATLFIAFYRPGISHILFAALTIRVFFLILGHYFISLPDSTADANSFEQLSWTFAKDGFSNYLSYYPGQSPKFLSWLIGFLYLLFGQSKLMAQSISLLFGIGTVFLGWNLARMIWDNQIAKKVAWILVLFPSLILYSILLLREIYIIFFILLALHGVFYWIKTNNLKSFFITIFGFTCATFFHGAMIIGAITFVAISGFISLKKIFESLNNGKIDLKTLIVVFLAITILILFYMNKIEVAYINNFNYVLNINNLLLKAFQSTAGTAAYPAMTIPQTGYELLYKIPLRSLYFLFSPFPWDIKEIKHTIGMIDGFFYIYLFYLVLRNIGYILNNEVLRIFLFILISYIFVFSFGVGNFGTGIRHRTKFLVIIILLAAPLIKSISFVKKRVKN